MSQHIAGYEYAGSIHSSDRQPNCRQTAGQDQKKCVNEYICKAFVSYLDTLNNTLWGIQKYA
jgi:hypothetical protein